MGVLTAVGLGCVGVISRIVRLRWNVARMDCCICCRACGRTGWFSIGSSSGAGGGIFGCGGIGVKFSSELLQYSVFQSTILAKKEKDNSHRFFME